MSVDDYRQSSWPGWSGDPGRPGPVEILENALGVVLQSPAVVGVLALTGLLSEVVPDLAGALLVDVGGALGVALAAPADRVHGADLPLPFRLVVALLATLLAAVPFAAAVAAALLVVSLPVGLLVLVGPGVYVSVRLFLATPAVMLDGHGPGRALARSWDLMGGSVLATLVAMVGVLAAGLAVAAPLAVVVGSEVLASAVAAAVVGSLAVGAQVSLYVEFTRGQ